MCVILVCPKGVRPNAETLLACERANPHGAGVAWREKDGRVGWIKNLSADEVGQMLGEIEGEAVVHFRWASVGGEDPLLCHPFPVSGKAEAKIYGTAKRVLFHNGTWVRWDEGLERMLRLGRCAEPPGPMSDTRAAALAVRCFGPDFLKTLPGRWALLDAGRTCLFGDWTRWHGMMVSNTAFVRRAGPARTGRRHGRWDDGPREQLSLWEGDL